MQNGSESGEATSRLDGTPSDGVHDNQWPEMEEWIAANMNNNVKAESFLRLS